jgi:hypothetical protein
MVAGFAEPIGDAVIDLDAVEVVGAPQDSQ